MRVSHTEDRNGELYLVVEPSQNGLHTKIKHLSLAHELMMSREVLQGAGIVCEIENDTRDMRDPADLGTKYLRSKKTDRFLLKAKRFQG